MWLRHGGVETLDSYEFRGDLDFLPESHLEFFESLTPFHEESGHFFTHAAYSPKIPLSEQEAEMLRWHSLHESAHPSLEWQDCSRGSHCEQEWRNP